MLFHTNSCGNSCSELTHVLLNHSRVFFDRLMCAWLCFTSVTGHSTRTHNACRFQHQTCRNLLLDYPNGHSYVVLATASTLPRPCNWKFFVCCRNIASRWYEIIVTVRDFHFNRCSSLNSASSRFATASATAGPFLSLACAPTLCKSLASCTSSSNTNARGWYQNQPCCFGHREIFHLIFKNENSASPVLCI